jgi:ribonuclease HII
MQDKSIVAIGSLIENGQLSESDWEALDDDPRRGVQALVNRERRRRLLLARATQRLDELLEEERQLWGRGISEIAGVDEVGVGPLAGPVLAAAVVLKPDTRILGVDDSKKLPHSRRVALGEQIREEAIAYAFGHCDPGEIDALNIYQASRLAMQRAVEALPLPVNHLLVDARTVPNVQIPQTSLIRGDSRSLSIAAASIIAKVERDRRMDEYAAQYPDYGFDSHRGYGTEYHLKALDEFGPLPIHRRSFAPVQEAERRSKALI